MFQKIHLNGSDVNVLVKGQGEPVLLVHGFPLDHTMWEFQIEDLSQDYCVIAPDLRGFGQSSKTNGTVTMKAFSDDLAELLIKLEIRDPVHVCGLSMGGYIAFQFWMDHKEQLKSLILCDTRAAADSEDAQELRYATADRVEKEGSGFLAGLMVGKLFSPVTQKQNPELITRIQETIRETHPESIAAASRGMAARTDFTSLLNQIEQPVLTIVGIDDTITSSQEMQTIATEIPHATFIVIPDAGHMAPLENPELVNQAIRQFLAAH